ncbi:hypothetical protein NEMBOFW57_004826 [Staphylotrichum longicolle]|uniref:Uncharacterized protein n=1 Tax=Staphylotrichum longicolle TaxID=669026 RepID=A0AAD4F068_9PEZI|nr:hypothetical protein NEMBOFW57_004826 [Staphylotrichum longicolle]
MALFPEWLLRSVRGENVTDSPVLAIERLSSLAQPLDDADKEILVGAVLTMSASLHLALGMLQNVLPQEKSQDRLGEVLHLHVEVDIHGRPETQLVKALQSEMRVQAAIHVAIESLEFAEGQLKVVKEVNQLHEGDFGPIQKHFYEGYNRNTIQGISQEDLAIMEFAEPDAETPLLVDAASPQESRTPSYHSILKPHASAKVVQTEGNNSGRSVEDDVLPETAVLGRNLGWSSAYILIISRVIGSGIFATPGSIVSSLVWTRRQKVYLEFTYRWPRFFASTLVAVHAIVLGFTASNCIVFGEYVLFALGRAPAEHPVHVRLLAVALMTGVTVLHGCFLRTGIVLQNILGGVKIGLVIFMTLASGAVVIGRYKPGEINVTTGLSKNSPFPSTWDGIWEGSVWNWGIVSTALFKVFYSYAGLQNVNNVLNEVRDPVRTLRSAAPTALATACLLYLLINVAYFLVIPLDEIKESGELVAALFFQRVFGHTLGKLLLPLAVAVSAAGNVMVVTFALARLNQEIARQGLLPFGETLSSSRPFGAPLGGLILHYIPSVIVISIPYKNIYSFILNEATEVLLDGTTVTKLIRVPRTGQN